MIIKISDQYSPFVRWFIILKLWDDEGYRLVCESIKHLVGELKSAQPKVQELISSGTISLEDFDGIQFHEITP